MLVLDRQILGEQVVGTPNDEATNKGRKLAEFFIGLLLLLLRRLGITTDRSFWIGVPDRMTRRRTLICVRAWNVSESAFFRR